MDPQHQHSVIIHGSSQKMTPYLALQTGLQSEHCCWICSGLLSFSVSQEHSKQHSEKTKTSVRKANKGKIPNAGRYILPSSTQELFANSKCWPDFQNSESLPKSSDFYGPGKEFFFQLVPSIITAITSSYI